MSEVEKFWNALQKFGFNNWRPWDQLHPQEQMQVVAGINQILWIVSK